MTAEVLIAPQTGAVTDIKFIEADSNTVPATLIATGLSGEEKIPVYISPDGGTTKEEAMQNNVAVELTAKNNVVSVNTPISLGVTKPETAIAVGVYMASGSSAV